MSNKFKVYCFRLKGLLLAGAITEKERWDKRFIFPRLLSNICSVIEIEKKTHLDFLTAAVLYPHFFFSQYYYTITGCEPTRIDFSGIISIHQIQKRHSLFYPFAYCPPFSMDSKHGHVHPSHSAAELGAKTV